MLLKARLGLLKAWSPKVWALRLAQEKLILGMLFEEAQSTYRRTFLFYC